MTRLSWAARMTSVVSVVTSLIFVTRSIRANKRSTRRKLPPVMRVIACTTLVSLDVSSVSVERVDETALTWHLSIANRGKSPVTLLGPLRAYLLSGSGGRYDTIDTPIGTLEPEERRSVDVRVTAPTDPAQRYRIFLSAALDFIQFYSPASEPPTTWAPLEVILP